MKNKRTRITLWIVVLFVLLLGGGALYFHKSLIAWYTSTEQSYLNEKEKPMESHSWNEGMLDYSIYNTNKTSSSGSTIPSNIPDKYNLSMEFHSQAPLLNWDYFHEEMCEEASILLVLNYFDNVSMTNQEFDDALQKMKEEEERNIGVWESTTVSQMKRFIETAYPSYRVEIIDNITQEQIEQYLASNIPVLLPMSGRTIGNPFYKPPGPIYHVLVIKGYTKTHFITNDVGTKRGKDFFYTKEIIMNNIHDWNEDNIFNGAKKGFVILPK